MRMLYTYSERDEMFISKEEKKMSDTNKLTKTQSQKLESFNTTSGKIRYLLSLGWKRGNIARKLKKRYQHVRNVELTPVKNPKES